MRGEAIHAMECEVLIEAIEAEETLQRRVLHLRRVGEAHVVLDQRENLVGVVVGEAQSATGFGTDRYADLNMVVETDAVRRDAKCRWLTDIMQERAPGEGERAARRELLEQEQRMDPDIALGMELRRLRDTFHARDFGQDFGEQASFIE